MNNEEEKLKKKANDLVLAFETLDLYNDYLLLKKEVETDSYLQGLKRDRDTLQKKLKYFKTEEKKDALKLAQKLNDEYNNSPLVINYLAIKKELESLLNSFTCSDF